MASYHVDNFETIHGAKKITQRAFKDRSQIEEGYQIVKLGEHQLFKSLSTWIGNYDVKSVPAVVNSKRRISRILLRLMGGGAWDLDSSKFWFENKFSNF